MGSQITVRCFAVFEERTGTDQLELEIDEEIALADLLDTLREQYPDIEKPLEHSAVAVNQRTVKPEETSVKPGDEVALLPPFGGGAVPYSNDMYPGADGNG